MNDVIIIIIAKNMIYNENLIDYRIIKIDKYFD